MKWGTPLTILPFTPQQCVITPAAYQTTKAPTHTSSILYLDPVCSCAASRSLSLSLAMWHKALFKRPPSYLKRKWKLSSVRT